ncbi:DUF6602 domain-containing protein [Desulfosporosinus sp. FKA]|uniref:DUF6602 domain-containing protein n=1 Tax=Desulfosporosinus sp. FKA TaxID=1969834 RepID=UPI000B4985FE|nr:DUF6602 domain-containing protein [Desulfosporosinus sp. FKA]
MEYMELLTKSNYTPQIFSRIICSHVDQIIGTLSIANEITHFGERGREAEGILRQFFEKALPKRFSVCSGFIYGASRISSQQDIIIYDNYNVAPLYVGESNEIVLINSVAATIECKTNLRNSSIDEIQEKCALVKAIHDPIQNTSDSEKWPPKPICSLFVYNSESSLEAIVNKLNSSKYHALDIVCCLSAGISFYNKEIDQYTLTTKEHILHGTTLDGKPITPSHHFFEYFYCWLMDRITEFKSVNINYIGQEMHSSINIDYK